MKSDEIIPITYIGGTGGNFLCHFIVSAKRNNKDIIKLSEHGNAHLFSAKDIIGPVQGLLTPDLDKIKYIFSQLPLSGLEKPYYTAAHLANISTINSYFVRSIRITYDIDDILNIAKVFYGKFIIDGERHKKSIKNISAEHYHWLEEFSFKENMTNVLFISWKELLYGNVIDLISKISIFTNIDKDRFLAESLTHWRNKTQMCIEKFTNIQ